MSGFPTRPSRSAFGPKPLDRRFPITPSKEPGADRFDLTWWQLAGLGVSGPVAFASFDAAGILLASGEAWDPDAQYLPTVSKLATGVYQVAYASSYPDKDGVQVTTSLLAALPAPQAEVDRRAIANVQANRRDVKVFTFNGAGAATDCACVLIIL